MMDGKRRLASGLAALLALGLIVVSAGPAGAIPADPTSAPIITTAAGNGRPGFGGDGHRATAAKLDFSVGVAQDQAGNLYLGDTNNNRVRKVATNGVISTVAGDGKEGSRGDGGAATKAALNHPTGLAVDQFGSIYIADTGNSWIRKVSPAGIISTIVAGGDCPHDDREEPDPNKRSRPEGEKRLCHPTGLAVDARSNLFITDSGHNQLKEFSFRGTLTTVAGTGRRGSRGDGGPADRAELNNPSGIALDGNHNLLIADTGSNKIRKVNAAGTITTFVGTGSPGFGGDGGRARLAKLKSPTGLGVDPLGNLYVSDSLNFRIRIVDVKGDIRTYAGTGQAGYSGDGGPATAARINFPTGLVALDGANVFFADSGNNRVRRIMGGPPPNIPEVPFNLTMLPLSALAVAAAAWAIVLHRRRQAGLLSGH